jgi:hypothetical protein
MQSRFSNPDQLNTHGFSLTLVTLIAGITAFVTASLALTVITLVAQLAAMACFTLGQKKS